MMTMMVAVMVITVCMICRLDSGDIDLYRIHSTAEGHVLKSYSAMMMMMVMVVCLSS